MFQKEDSTIPIEAARLMITDLCPYSCKWCAVYSFKSNSGEEATFGGNEGALVQDYRESLPKYLKPDDYGFLASSLDIEDFTLTGGDPLIRKDIGQIAAAIKVAKPSSRITTLTKGAPLFGKSPEQIQQLLGPVDRVIFSLDTINAQVHADLNLPLEDPDKAKSYLPKTLDAIRATIEAGFQVEINTVVPPFQTTEDLSYLRDIIEFTYGEAIHRIKLIELDLPKVSPGYIDQLPRILFDNNLPSVEVGDAWTQNDSTNSIIAIMDRCNDVHFPLEISIHRVTCSTSRFRGEMMCTLDQMGELLLDTTGRANACRHTPSRNIDLRDAIIQRDREKLLASVQKLDTLIKAQACPMLECSAKCTYD